MYDSTNRFTVCSRIALSAAIILASTANLVDGGSGNVLSSGDDPVDDALMIAGRDPIPRTLRIASALGFITAFITCIIGWRQSKQFPLLVLPISGFVIVAPLLCWLLLTLL